MCPYDKSQDIYFNIINFLKLYKFVKMIKYIFFYFGKYIFFLFFVFIVVSGFCVLFMVSFFSHSKPPWREWKQDMRYSSLAWSEQFRKEKEASGELCRDRSVDRWEVVRSHLWHLAQEDGGGGHLEDSYGDGYHQSGSDGVFFVDCHLFWYYFKVTDPSWVLGKQASKVNSTGDSFFFRQKENINSSIL